MLATQTPESGPEAKDVKQWIKEKIAWTLKALQKRYITTDTAVTSEDLEANLLCCALEAAFIHGIKSKFIRYDGGHSRKGGSRGTLPQPVFWSLLKTVTHRDVVQELDRLNFINSDIGRCRAWVRLALNDGLMECYLTSLLREGSKLGSYYQPGALLLDPEDREVLLTLLQGLASMTFQLSYKSAVLNEWTNTPLVLAGLCPPTPADEHLLGPKRKESWDTVSQSSGGSGSSDWAPEAIQRESRKEQSEGCETSTPLTSSNLSLNTSGSSQLSSSLSSDSLLQGQEPRSPENEHWSCDMEIVHKAQQNTVTEENSQDLKKEDIDVFMPAPDIQLQSDSAKHAVDGKTHMSDTDMHQSDEHVTEGPKVCTEKISAEALQETEEGTMIETKIIFKSTRLKVKHAVTGTTEREQKRENRDSSVESPSVSTVEKTNDLLKDPDTLLPETSSAPSSVEQSRHAAYRRTASTVSRKISSDSLYSSCKSTSWISEDDFYKPEETGSSEACAVIDVTQLNEQVTPTSEPETLQSPPSVVHRRQNGLPNPFRGLLKLGQLERRSAVGMWWDYYCELSPFELRLYNNAEERICYENLSLLRCEDVRLSSEGRFRLSFLNKRIYLRAPSPGEAEDWVDRIMEAISKLRPMMRDEQWEVLQTSSEQEVPSPTPSSPERTISELPDPPQLDWTRHKDPELDAIKEAVVYQNLEEKGWRSLVLSLSLETLKGFQVQDDSKTPLFSYSIGAIRDVVPDVSLGSPAFFKILTARDTLTLRAESGEEAQGWRSLIRGALDLYLETEDDGEVLGVSSPGGHGGSIHKLVQHRLKGDGTLLSHLSEVPKERGLDTQNYKCAGCPRQIGLSLGKARLCEFSGQYYCDSCHHGDMTIIPSRMVHNWDLATREVSRQAFKLLTQIEHEPLLNLDVLNPDLFDHTDIVAKVQTLRQRLRFLGDYILICRSGIGKQVQPRLQQRTYLLDNCDVYSVLDLQQIADGHYESYLQSLIEFGSKHVYNCDLCTQRGFICQICNSDNIIFPFQFDSTSRCKVCKTVFHSSCKAKCPVCPRCVRIQKYLERDLED
ncbi:pleckstrin homology domain-containing family M member 1 [Pseudorasbora parva]|uniref:pleckstrin homology domain-containing family M member 1 n=1 Tax=Pseudorasbora parva TaxID=51549 RepID=UPI00351EB87A